MSCNFSSFKFVVINNLITKNTEVVSVKTHFTIRKNEVHVLFPFILLMIISYHVDEDFLNKHLLKMTLYRYK